MHSVDPVFARKYTALAVTHGFQGSPHIDKQNVGPFYGLALGDFEEGTGGICVECSARVVGTYSILHELGSLARSGRSIANHCRRRSNLCAIIIICMHLHIF